MTHPARHPANRSRRIRSASGVPGLSETNLWSGLGDAWSALGTLIGGIVVWGGLGMLGDRWLRTAPWLMVVGVMLGLGAATYLLYVKSLPRREDANDAP